jgi:hypothetical protein
MDKKFLTYENYKEKVKILNDKYWNDSFKGRWVYMKPVIDELKKMSPESALELGSYKISLMDFSDNMGLDSEYFDPENLKNKHFIFDARNTPWKDIKDKEYDVFVALQVLEHLSPNQSEVFNEIKRISKKCILTLPYKWDCPTNKTHHNITDKIISNWTNNIEPYKKLVLGDNSKRLRIMLCYNFD